MKRKTVRFLITLCWGESLIFLSILVGRYEGQMPHGFSQVTFLLGALFGMLTAIVIKKVDARFAENEERDEVTERSFSQARLQGFPSNSRHLLNAQRSM